MRDWEWQEWKTTNPPCSCFEGNRTDTSPLSSPSDWGRRLPPAPSWWGWGEPPPTSSCKEGTSCLALLFPLTQASTTLPPTSVFSILTGRVSTTATNPASSGTTWYSVYVVFGLCQASLVSPVASRCDSLLH